MKRLLLLALALVLLCSCGQQPAASAVMAPVPLPPDEASARRTLVFLVDSAGDSIYREAATVFAQKVGQLTGGIISVEVSSSVGPVVDYLAGKAQLCFVDSRRNPNFSEDFPILVQPMRYANYQSFTLAINSKRVLERLNVEVGEKEHTRLLGAFFQGSNQLVSRLAPVKGNLSDEALDGESVVAVRPDSGIAELFTNYGVTAVSDQNHSNRLQMLLEGSAVVAEFSPSELLDIDWRDTGLYLLGTNHTITPRFLAMDSIVYDELSPGYQAAITEACAYLYPIIDNHYLQRDAEIVVQMKDQGIITGKTFDGLRIMAAKRDGADVEANPRKRILLNLLNNIA